MRQRKIKRPHLLRIVKRTVGYFKNENPFNIQYSSSEHYVIPLNMFILLMLDRRKHLSFRTVHRYFKRFSCQLFKWFFKNIHPGKKLPLWDMMSILLHVIFCSGPVYLYAIHIFTSNLLFFLVNIVEYYAFIAAGLFLSLLCGMIFTVLFRYMIYQKTFWDFGLDLQITKS